ncbi:hypothetical protein J437_LFUL002371 [Ladona fulva]|uniref:Uncharacterized protein n=1 Tax=Ladona fulva TaxID=123851 RepID=A0A8K0NZI5_LADFU|nr:hypothetical protein J437_LFUL002371 [Ladona fulva]
MVRGNIRERMISKRNAILRLSIFFNVVVLLYVATHLGSGGEDVAVDPANPPSGRNLASIEGDGEESLPTAPALIRSPNFNSSSGSRDAGPTIPPTTTRPPILEAPTLAQMIGCFDKRPLPRYRQRGDHWVLSDYVIATKRFSCDESVTYTTHGDFTFLDNLVPLVEKWRGPVSVALFAPGEDFAFTLSAISYARSCLTPLVRELVTFHIYFGVKDIPSAVPKPTDKDFLPEFDCNGKAPPLPFGKSAPYISYKSESSKLISFSNPIYLNVTEAYYGRSHSSTSTSLHPYSEPTRNTGKHFGRT